MRAKKLAWNTISSLAWQITTLVCGFITPQLFLRIYGSEVNGLINSITQFLEVITLMELGMGSVIQSSLYKPLAEKNHDMVSCVMVSGTKFFRFIGRALLIYVIFLMIIYPIISNQAFGYSYTAFLIFAMSVSLFAQYYFGITDQLLLYADQKNYIQSCLQIACVVINTIVCVGLMLNGYSVHIVKLVTSAIFLIRPLLVRIYVNKHYRIDRKITYNEEPIEQKWNGVAQHIAYFILCGTDNIVLTIFASLTDVSIYSVYNMVIVGVKNLFASLSSGIQSVFGEMLAKGEMAQLYDFFGRVEWLLHTGVTFVFGCTAVLIVPFVKVYTKGVNDAVYNVPTFALLLTLGNALNCLKLPYNMMIFAGGHYRQTQSNYIITALMNIILSIILVRKYGLTGVAVGTLVAMAYQAIWMAYYALKNLIKFSFRRFCKQICIDVLTFSIAFYLTGILKITSNTYMAWLILAVKTGVIWLTVILVINRIFYRDNIKYLRRKILRKVE